MTEPELRDLLGEAAGDPPRLLDADDLVAAAGRRRLLRLGAGAATAAAVVVTAVVVVPGLLPGRPEVVGVPSATPTPNVPLAPSTATWPPECPGPDAAAGAVAVDYADVVVHAGRTYGGASTTDDVPLGEPVMTVRCTIYEISGGGLALVPGPWPDGTATFLPRGTVVHAIAGQDQRCYLVADLGTSRMVFRGQRDETDHMAMPDGCTPGYGPWAEIERRIADQRQAEAGAAASPKG